MGLNYFLLVFFSFPMLCYAQNVGINTSDPQQKLHLGGPNATMKIDAFSSDNNVNNYSAEVTSPLYVDKDGILTLDFEPYYSSGGIDDFDGSLNTSNILQPSGVSFVEQELYRKVVTVPRASYIQVSYSMSFSVENPSAATITDGLARVVQTYMKVDNLPRKFGMVAQCYVNNSTYGAKQVLYNSGSAYILVPAGTHIISFYGGVGCGSNTEETFVNFGLDQDMLLMRLF